MSLAAKILVRYATDARFKRVQDAADRHRDELRRVIGVSFLMAKNAINVPRLTSALRSKNPQAVEVVLDPVLTVLGNWIRSHSEPVLRRTFNAGARAARENLRGLTLPRLASMRIAAFDPDQARDENGQWTAGGGRAPVNQATHDRSVASVAKSSDQMTPTVAAHLHADTFAGARNVGDASEAYLRQGDEGLARFVDSKGGPVYEDQPFGQATSMGGSRFQDQAAAAKHLVEGIRSAPEKDVSLYRGVGFEERHAFLESLQPGDSVALDRLSSFSSERGYAAFYADGKGSHKYEIRIEGKSKTLPTDSLTGKNHREHLTQGRFEVTSVSGPEKIRYTGTGGNIAIVPNTSEGNTVKLSRVITLRHRGVF